MSCAGTSETQNIALVRRGYEAFAKGCEFRGNPATDSDLKPATVPI